MALWNNQTPPVLYPDAVATEAGWADPVTGELLVTVTGLSTFKGGAAELVKFGLFTGKDEFNQKNLALPKVYSAGQYMVVEAVFSEAVSWTGDAPQVTGTINGNARTFAYFQDLTDMKAHTADKVMSVTIGNGGSHYQVGDLVTFTGGGGSSAQGVVTTVDASNAITGIQMVSNGAGYATAPTAAVDTGHVVGVTVGGSGTAYVDGDKLIFTGGGGTGAAGYIVTDGAGNVSKVVMTNTGTGYTSAPSVAKTNLYGSGNTFTAKTSYGSGAVLTAVLGTPANGNGTNRILFRYQIQANETATSSQIVFTSPLGSVGATTWVDADSAQGASAAATAVTASGVTSYTVSNGGSGYTSAPSVVVSGDGTGATAVAVLDKGIDTATLVNPGAGYRSVPAVTISGDVGNSDGAVTAVLAATASVVDVTIGGTADVGIANNAALVPTGGGGTGFAGTVQTTGGDITGVTITNAGTGYTSAPSLTVAGLTNRTLTAVTGKAVASFTVTAGTGFLVAPTLTVAPPTATSATCHAGAGVSLSVRATATATLKNLQTVASLTPVTDGSGYTAATVAFSGGGGTNAAASAVVTGEVDHVNVTAAGSSYWLAPTVGFSGGGGTNAAATATVDRGRVTGVTMTNHGSGYTSAPTVAFTATAETPTLTFDATQFVSSVSISGTGSDYSQGTPLVFSTGAGAGTIVVDFQGNITGVVITNGGSYASAPTITVTAPPAWSSSTTYPANSVVLYSGTRYRSKLNGNLNQTPGVATSYWLALADQTLTAVMGSTIVGSASVDGVAPTITAASVAFDRFGDASTQTAFATGDWVTVQFTCSKPVYVTKSATGGVPYVPFTITTQDAARSPQSKCFYFGGSGTTKLTFAFQVMAGDVAAASGFAFTSPVALSAAEADIVDAAGNALVYSFTPPTTTAFTIN